MLVLFNEMLVLFNEMLGLFNDMLGLFNEMLSVVFAPAAGHQARAGVPPLLPPTVWPDHSRGVPRKDPGLFTLHMGGCYL